MDIFELIDIEVKKSIVRTEHYDITELEKLLDIAYDNIYECKDDLIVRKNISKLSQVFHSIGDNSIAVLACILMRKLNELNGIKIIKQPVDNIEPENDKILDFIESELKLNAGQFNFFQHKKGSTTLGKKKLYVTLSNMLRYYINDADLQNSDIVTPVILLINMWEISPKLGRLHEFYILFCSFLHKLHFQQQTQTIRDFAETSIALGFRNKTLHYAFYIRMAIYSRQYNMIDSLLSAHLMLHGYNYCHEENQLFLSKSLLEVFIALRNFRLFSYAEQILEAHDKLHVDDPYDKHQFEMAWFNMKLLMRDKKIFELTDEYLNANDVLEFDVASGRPWLVFLLNLKKIDRAQFDTYHNLTESLNRLEAHEVLNKEVVIQDYKKAMSNDIKQNKEAVLKGISNILKSRSLTDVGYELSTLQPIALNLLKNSIKSRNIEGILIAHALYSGPSDFHVDHEEPITEFIPIFAHEMRGITSPNIFDDYLEHLSDLATQSEQSTFLWIGACDDFCYSVSLRNKLFSLYINDKFTKKDITQWESSQTELLAFNDQPNLKSILDTNEEHWQNESLSIKDTLPILTDISEENDIILFRDVNIACLPPNLIKTTAGTLLVDLAPLHIPRSIESHIKKVKFTVDSTKVKLWAPVEEGDFAINIAYDKIQSLFDNNTLLKVTSLDPKTELNRDINIFISHGGKDRLYGFKSISPAEDKYFVNERDLFGYGKIAILFICHSGSSKSSMFATKLDGLVNRVFDLGYECVLAPAWSYNVILTGIWTRSFIDALNSGKSLARATYDTNMLIKATYPSVGAYAAMHLFGNDNLVSSNYLQ
ncbi:hypothetical protein ACRXLK_000773 [Cronobacter turicensis]|nr:hypothetical protein [Cronobacter turicensis]